MKRVVGVIIFCVAALLAMGLIALYSTTYSKLSKRGTKSSTSITASAQSLSNGMGNTQDQEKWRVAPRQIQGMNVFKKQAKFVLIGILLCACIWKFFNYRVLLQDWVPFSLFVVSFILLLIVFFPVLGGVSVKGSRRWIQWGMSFQPSELAKLTTVICLAWYGARFPSNLPRFWKGLIFPMGVLSILVVLIFLEPDAGSTIFLMAIISGMLLIMGARWFYLFIPAGLASAAMGIWLCYDTVRRARLLSWLDVEGTKNDVGMQAYSSLVAFGSGGFFGKGLGSGVQKMGFLPEDHTDFILPIIGEEMGLVATLFILVLYSLLIFCGCKVALHARDRFGVYLAMGITCMIGLQALINVGVVTSVFPNKGMPLPFISQGGTNVVMLLISVGILFCIAKQGVWDKSDESFVSERVPNEEEERDDENIFRTGGGRKV